MSAKRFFIVLIFLAFVFGLAVKPAQASTCTQWHTVKRGEYLSQIARMYGVSWRWLANINNLTNPNKIYPGQQLCVETSDGLAVDCTRYHTVKPGEYLSQIARYYGVSWRWLAEINNLSNPNKLYPGQVLCVATDDDYPPGGQQPDYDPLITVLSVDPGDSVSVGLNYFPPYDQFNVYMYEYGDDPDNGMLIDKVNTGNGAYQKMWFAIPWELRYAYRINLRMESPTSHYSAITSFYNNTESDPGDSDKYNPTITILAVSEDFSVTIRANDLPPNDNFQALMGKMGTKGKDGIPVGFIETGKGGNIEATFRIPDQLKGQYQIAIRIESPTSGYFAYNWFHNAIQ